MLGGKGTSNELVVVAAGDGAHEVGGQDGPGGEGVTRGSGEGAGEGEGFGREGGT